MGFEYELLRSFAEHMQLELRIIVAKNLDEVLLHLANGEADIVCANLTVTEERLKLVNFSEPIINTRQVLVQKKPEHWQYMTRERLNESLIRTTIDLAGKEIYVRQGSSFRERLDNLQEEIAAVIPYVEVPGGVTTEDLISGVAAGSIPYTIADENVAQVNQRYYPNIDIQTAISFPQKIGWAVNKNSPLLLAKINSWLTGLNRNGQIDILYAKYFKSPKFRGRPASSSPLTAESQSISEYDDIIRIYAKEIGWDWRLLAAMIYQESKFDPEARSWAGACGLMQLIPSTAKKFGIDSCQATPIESINAGTKYLIELDNYWKKLIPNPSERIQFTLASYNAGLGHVIDARNLARKYGRPAELWQQNVESFLLLKSNPRYYNDPIVHCGYCRGEEPFNYVREILTRYHHYKNIIPENASKMNNKYSVKKET